MHTHRLNITMVLLASALTSAQAFRAPTITTTTEENDNGAWRAAGALSLGTINGEGREHVYSRRDDGSRYTLSRLDWEINDVLMLGANVSFVRNTLSINAGMWVALNDGSGEMEDYDWDGVFASWEYYSVSPTELTTGLIFDANIAFRLISDWAGVNASLFTGFKYDNWEWDAIGGIAYYPEYNYVPHVFPNDPVITYQQEFGMIYLGAELGWQLGDFSVTAYAMFSPIVYAKDYDSHWLRDIDFEESFEKGNMYAAGMTLRYHFSDRFFVTGNMYFQKIDTIVGDMEIFDHAAQASYMQKNAAGIDNESLAASLSLGLTF